MGLRATFASEAVPILFALTVEGMAISIDCVVLHSIMIHSNGARIDLQVMLVPVKINRGPAHSDTPNCANGVIRLYVHAGAKCLL